MDSILKAKIILYPNQPMAEQVEMPKSVEFWRLLYIWWSTLQRHVFYMYNNI